MKNDYFFGWNRAQFAPGQLSGEDARQQEQAFTGGVIMAQDLAAVIGIAQRIRFGLANS